MVKIQKRYCNNCGKYYEGFGKQYCSYKCSNIYTAFRKGHIPWNKGYGDYIKGEKNYFYKNHHKKETKDKLSKIWKDKFTKGYTHPMLGKTLSNESKAKITESLKTRWKNKEYREQHSKENSPKWLGGISFEPYGPNFNKKFKKAVRDRDNYCCVICNKHEKELGYVLPIHHIDYNKKNNLPQNCVSLCINHHSNTNISRQNWTSFFQLLLKDKYGYGSTNKPPKEMEA